MIGATVLGLTPWLNCWGAWRSGDIWPHEMSDIGGFELPGFDTGGGTLHASGTVRAPNMLPALQTQRSLKRPIHPHCGP